MENTIKKKIQSKFGNQNKFCSEHGYEPKTLSAYVDRIINKLNRFLKPLDLKTKIVDIDEKES